MSALNAFRQRYLVRFWSPLPALVALGVASAYYFALTGTFWAVTGEFTRWGGHVLSWFDYQLQDWSYFRLIGLQGTPLDRIDEVMIIGMFLGALCYTLWAGNVSLRWPTSKRRLLQGLVGGIVAGFGACLAMSRNLAAFFTGISMFPLHAWVFMFATAGSAWVGVKISLLPFLRTSPKIGVTASALPDAESLARCARLQTRLGLAVLALAALFVTWRFEVPLVLGMACLFDLLFGGLIERAQICFTSAVRDLWTTGQARAAFGILLGMVAACIGTFATIRPGVAPKIFWMGPNAIVGGILFSIGIVLAGGCETGWMYRLMESQMHFWVVGIGNVIGGTLVAIFWDQLGTRLALPYSELDLPESFGPGNGLLLTFAGLALYLLLVQLNTSRFTRSRKPNREPDRQTDPVA